GMGVGGVVPVDGRVLFPHSLGTFYEAMTQYLGFPHYGDEYKVMGLAPYGKPSFLAEMRELVQLLPDGTYRLGLDYFRHHREAVTHQCNNCAPEVGTLFAPVLEKLLGPARTKGEPLTQRHKDIAHSTQAMYEEAFFHLLNSAHARYRCDRLTLAGGCAMNSVANGKIRQRTPFRSVYIQAAAGDAGGAIGAALALASRMSGGARWRQEHAYWGPSYSDEQCAELLMQERERMREHAIAHVADDRELCERVAQALAKGCVVGWFQGRMEWGPRALGNRSILADPRRPDMKDILNQKVKRRESFRPFAPSILREQVGEWFEQDDDVPFMSQVFQVREARRAQIPAVTHVDGSGRLQTVRREANPRYYRLIETFGALTGVPILLNTS
ncbi:MAG: carbamoyltransferase family protein, partial [Lysobacterales bacterium]